MDAGEETVAGKEVAFPASVRSGRMVYRAMREDPAGGPMAGPSARMLGVRPGSDIPVVGGQVIPLTGGMSVAPDRPDNLHPMRRPPAYGGIGKDPIWFIDVALLGCELEFHADSPTHGLIEPVRTMTIDEFQQALKDSKAHWKKLP